MKHATLFLALSPFFPLAALAGETVSAGDIRLASFECYQPDVGDARYQVSTRMSRQADDGVIWVALTIRDLPMGTEWNYQARRSFEVVNGRTMVRFVVQGDDNWSELAVDATEASQTEVVRFPATYEQRGWDGSLSLTLECRALD